MSGLPRLRIGEIVLGTARYDEMREWYRGVLDVAPYYEHVHEGPPADASTSEWRGCRRLAFFRLVADHPYQQVLALFEVAGLQPATAATAGLHHLQLRDASPAVMARRLASLRDVGIVAFRARDHGPTTSFYFHDPDRNVVEVAAPNMADLGDYLAAARTPEFLGNPSGKPLGLQEFIDRHGTGG